MIAGRGSASWQLVVFVDIAPGLVEAFGEILRATSAS